MNITRQMVIGIMAALLLAPVMVLAESAQEAFDRGQALLAKGQFEPAVEALGIAAKADATNEVYVKRYTVARRVVDFRAKLETETDPAKWEATAKALRSFYIREKLNDEALAIAERMNEKLQTTSSNIFLAETQLAVDRNEDAVKTLNAIPADKVNAHSQGMLAIALMETGKSAEAKALLDKLTVPADATPGAKFLVARAYGKAGDSARAIQTLQAFFESVPPAQLDAMKAQAKAMPEFEKIVGTPEFAAVLETKSKVDESKCTGGSDCSTCPIGTKCPTGEKK